MTKEMVVSASPQDTKIAILEDGQLVEVYFEREREYSLAGSIYKGRVTRILPGMQSAFVNIGLERDAFLYVSDFLEQVEEYDRVGTTGPERETSRRPSRREEPEQGSPPVQRPASVELPVAADGPMAAGAAIPAMPDEAPPVPPDRSGPRGEAGGNREKPRRFSRRSRRHRGRHQGIPESKYARSGAPVPEAPPPAESAPSPAAPILLPGESFAKYKDQGSTPESPPASSAEKRFAEASLEVATGAPAVAAAQVSAPAATAGEEALANTGAEQGTAVEFRKHVEAPPSWEPDEEMPDSPVAPHTSDSDVAESRDFLSVEEAVEAVREEKIIEELEEEAAEMAESESQPAAPLDAAPDSEEFPGWALLEDRVLDVIDDAEPDSPYDESQEASPEVSEAGFEEPFTASAIESSEPGENAGRGESAEGTRQAAVRERSSNPRFQRQRRWESRKPVRGEQSRRGPRTSERETPKPLIGDMLKEGQEILVQIAKEPLGKKGARITSHIALPGRYIVYMPTLDHVGVSRKISSDEERHRLKRIIVEHTRNLSGGFIVRTAGEGHSEEDLRQDVQFLVKLWGEIKAKAEKSAAPALLHHDLDLTLRTLRDQLSDEFQAIWVDNEQAYEQIVSLVQKFQPALVHRVRLYTKEVPLFEETGVQDEINKALKPKVWLKSGGYIVINQTEALVAIDVNTGKFVGKSNSLEDTIVKTNVEAIQEIVRQIRLRDLGGIIVIDFIDMDERKNRQKVMSTLDDAMRADKAPSKILSFNEFGLLAITRKRVRQSLERTLCQPCAYCTGSGLVKSPATMCLEILTEAKKMASELEGKLVTLRLNPEVGKALKSRGNGVLEALEEITGRGVIIRNDEAVHIENFYFD